jgi:hypothetical protein
MFGPSSSKLVVRIAVLAVAIGVTLYFCLSARELDVSPKTGVIMDLPETLVGLPGKEQEVSEGERFILPKDTEFAKMAYNNGKELHLNAQIVLAGAEKRSIHRPEVCLPAQGWTVKSTQTLDVPLESGHNLQVTLLNITRPIGNDTEVRELTQLFCYWFVGSETTTPSHFVRVVKTNMDVLLHNTNHRWAYVIVSAPVTEGFVQNGMNLSQTKEMLVNAIRELAPKIMKAEQHPSVTAGI